MTNETPSGMLNSPPAAESERTPAGGELKQIAEKIEAAVRPEDKELYERILTAGMQAMWDNDETHAEMMQYLEPIKQNPSQLVQLVSHGIIKLISIVWNQSGLPQEQFMAPSASAAIVLMAQALEFVQKKMGVPIDNETIAACAKAVVQGLFELYNVTPEQIDQAMTQREQGPAGPAGGA